MKRIVLAAISTLAALIALFSYPTSTGHSASTASESVSGARVVTGGPTASSTAESTTGQGPDPATTGGTTSASTSAVATTTVNGATEMTRYGAVQVEVVITNGTITDVIALQYPTAGREDQQINSRAIPQLRSQVLAAQSAKIDGVSGATFTTDGYISSLQSALDAAGVQQ